MHMGGGENPTNGYKQYEIISDMYTIILDVILKTDPNKMTKKNTGIDMDNIKLK